MTIGDNDVEDEKDGGRRFQTLVWRRSERGHFGNLDTNILKNMLMTFSNNNLCYLTDVSTSFQIQVISRPPDKKMMTLIG